MGILPCATELVMERDPKTGKLQNIKEVMRLYIIVTVYQRLFIKSLLFKEFYDILRSVDR